MYSTRQMQLQLQTRFARSVNASANIFTRIWSEVIKFMVRVNAIVMKCFLNNLKRVL